MIGNTQPTRPPVSALVDVLAILELVNDSKAAAKMIRGIKDDLNALAKQSQEIAERRADLARREDAVAVREFDAKAAMDEALVLKAEYTEKRNALRDLLK